MCFENFVIFLFHVELILHQGQGRLDFNTHVKGSSSQFFLMILDFGRNGTYAIIGLIQQEI